MARIYCDKISRAVAAVFKQLKLLKLMAYYETMTAAAGGGLCMSTKYYTGRITLRISQTQSRYDVALCRHGITQCHHSLLAVTTSSRNS